jgi:hypothetical protein
MLRARFRVPSKDPGGATFKFWTLVFDIDLKVTHHSDLT